jgi:hypothetical protein
MPDVGMKRGRQGRGGLVTEYFQGRFLGEDVLGVCAQFLDPRDVFVGAGICDNGIRDDVKGDEGGSRTGAADQETVVLVDVGGIDLFDDVVAVEGEGDVCAHKGQPRRQRSRKCPPEVICLSDEDKKSRNI